MDAERQALRQGEDVLVGDVVAQEERPPAAELGEQPADGVALGGEAGRQDVDRVLGRHHPDAAQRAGDPQHRPAGPGPVVGPGPVHGEGGVLVLQHETLHPLQLGGRLLLPAAHFGQHRRRHRGAPEVLHAVVADQVRDHRPHHLVQLGEGAAGDHRHREAPGELAQQGLGDGGHGGAAVVLHQRGQHAVVVEGQQDGTLRRGEQPGQHGAVSGEEKVLHVVLPVSLHPAPPGGGPRCGGARERASTPPGARPRLQCRPVPRILVVDGHLPTRELVSASLSQAGLQVVAAADARAAWELYAADRPDAVVLGADAEGVVALSQRLRRADPRLLLLVTDREHLGRALGLAALLPLKADAYVADPTRRQLLEKLRQLLERGQRTRHGGTALVLAREPTARGEVAPGVVPRLLHQIWRSLSEGILVLEGAGVTRRVAFRHGVPVAAHSDDPGESLLARLRLAGRLDGAAHDVALEALAGGLSPGAALIAAGVAEPGGAVHAELADHLRALVVRAVGVREGHWRFHPGAEFAADGPLLELLPLQVILEGARLGIPAGHLAAALKAVTGAYPVRTGEFQQLLPAAGLGSADLRLALSLDGRTTTRAWLEGRASDLKDALSLLWFLSMVGAVAFREEPGEHDAYGSRPPPRRRALPPERGDAIRQAALRILPGTYLHALGVELDADDEAVERAYRTVAPRFHPDGYAEYDVGDLTDLLATIQDRLAAAYRVLGNAGRRRAYLAYLLVRLEQTGARRPGIDLDAELCLKRGQRALLLRRHAEAASALREAVRRNPREPEYQALLALALLFDPGQSAAEGAQDRYYNITVND